MAYIGKEPIVGNFQVCDAISVVNGQAAYTMQVSSTNVVPESANHMLVSLNGILQKPNSSFTVSGSTITFASNLATGDVIDFIMLLGNVLDIGTPSDSTVTDAKTNFVSTSSAAGLQIKGDSTTAGTLQLNCEQNSHGVKLRSPAHSSGQSYTLTLPTGNVTADKFLKVASVSGSGTTGIGQLSFADAGGGAYEKLLTTTASNSGYIAFSNTYITSTYRDYKIVISNLKAQTGGQHIYLYFSTDNGSSYVTSGSKYDSTIKGRNSGGSDTNGSNASQDFLKITADTLGADSTRGCSGFIELIDPLDTSTKCEVYGQLGYFNNSDNRVTAQFAGNFRDETAVNNIAIQMASGNIVSGTFTIYGRKN